MEYREINAHLRANIVQFINWFSFFLTFSFALVVVFVAMGAYRPALAGFALVYGVQIIFLLLHILAFVGIFTFRRYMVEAHRRVEEIVRQLAGAGESPIPMRFNRWMTDLMAAGFVLSYFTWFSLLFIR